MQGQHQVAEVARRPGRAVGELFVLVEDQVPEQGKLNARFYQRLAQQRMAQQHDARADPLLAVLSARFERSLVEVLALDLGLQLEASQSEGVVRFVDQPNQVAALVERRAFDAAFERAALLPKALVLELVDRI